MTDYTAALYRGILFLACVVFWLSVVLFASSWAHDIYSPLREGMSPAGRLCCGGDPVTGDCEAVDYQMMRNGDAVILSKRYGGKQVHIAKERIQWFAVPGGEQFEAHWCGKPRTGSTPDKDDPDPNFTTFCIFIRPGGV